MGLMVVPRREQRRVGGDKRYAFGIGKFNQSRLRKPLSVRSLPLELHIEAIAKKAQQGFTPSGSEAPLPGGDGHIQWAARSAGERNQTFGIVFKPCELEVRLLIWRCLQESPG